MQTDRQVLGRLQQEVRLVEKRMEARGLRLNPQVLCDSSDEEERMSGDGVSGSL
jgi:hypothetical protein